MSKTTIEKVFDVLAENNRRAGRLQGISDVNAPKIETPKEKSEHAPIPSHKAGKEPSAKAGRPG